MGRSRKIPMQKRDAKEKLNVTFTKRRTGLFHKAAELSRLCDAQVAVLVSAPNRKSYYSFSPTSVDGVLESFLAGRAPERVSERITRDAHRLAGEIESLEATLRRATEFRKAAGTSGRGGCPWEALQNYEESATTVEELQALHYGLSKLRAKYDPAASCSRTASNVVSPAFCGFESDSTVTDFVGSLWSDSNPNLEFVSPEITDMATDLDFLNNHGTCTSASFSRAASNDVSAVVISERGDDVGLHPIGCPQPCSSCLSWDDVGLEYDLFWSDSNPNLEFLSPEN